MKAFTMGCDLHILPVTDSTDDSFSAEISMRNKKCH